VPTRFWAESIGRASERHGVSLRSSTSDSALGSHRERHEEPWIGRRVGRAAAVEDDGGGSGGEPGGAGTRFDGLHFGTGAAIIALAFVSTR